MEEAEKRYALLTKVTYHNQPHRIWGIRLLALSTRESGEIYDYDLMPEGKRSLYDIVQFVLPHHIKPWEEPKHNAEILHLKLSTKGE